MKIFLLLPLLVVFFGLQSFGQSLPTGTGVFTYNGYGPLRSKPIKVFYRIPTDVSQATMPVLMVLHGEDRTAIDYLNDWISAANQYHFMVIAPEFPDSSYTGGDGYNLANMFINGDSPSTATQNPDSVWTFSILDPLFNYIKQRTQTSYSKYVAFGHSAGSQLLHKFVMYKPNSLCAKAICANAGWYTLANNRVTFPYGTNRSPSSQQLLTAAFAQPLTVQLGAQDNDPNSAGLRHNTTVDQQGLNRLARGRYYYANASAQAITYGVPFNWNIVEESGIGHDHTGMARRAIPYVNNAFLLTSALAKEDEPKMSCSLFQNNIFIQNYKTDMPATIKLYAMDGKLLYSSIQVITSDFVLPISLPLGAVYLISIEAQHTYFRYSKLLVVQ